MWIGFCFISNHFRFVFVLFSVFLIHCLRGGSKRCGGFLAHCETRMCWCACVSARIQLQAHQNNDTFHSQSDMYTSLTQQHEMWIQNVFDFSTILIISNLCKNYQQQKQKQQQPSSSVYFCFWCSNRCHLFVIWLLTLVVVAVWYFISRLLYLLLFCLSVIYTHNSKAYDTPNDMINAMVDGAALKSIGKRTAIIFFIEFDYRHNDKTDERRKKQKNSRKWMAFFHDLPRTFYAIDRFVFLRFY